MPTDEGSPARIDPKPLHQCCLNPDLANGANASWQKKEIDEKTGNLLCIWICLFVLKIAYNLKIFSTELLLFKKKKIPGN